MAETAARCLLMALGVVVPWLINLTNAGVVARSETVIMAVKLAMLMVVIAAGLPSVSIDRLASQGHASPLSVLAAGLLVFVAYEGFELIANASADARRPSKTLPRALALSVGLANGQLFTGVLAFSPGFDGTPDTRGKPRVFVSHGIADDVLPIDRCSRRIVSRLKRLGYAVTYREFDGPHLLPEPVAREAFAWMFDPT